jgi:arabinofuranosyltransferase
MPSHIFTSPKRRDITLILLIAAAFALAYFNRFVQDDAFISFRYAQNLADGQGLVWNAGERIEGYTNFLWTILMTVPLAAGIDVVAFSYAVGLLSLVGTLFFTFKLSRLVCRSNAAALLTVLLLGANYSFSAYATGGLETQLHAFLIAAAVFTALSGIASKSRLLAASLLSAAALLTRLDSAVVLAPVYAFVLWRVWKTDQSMAAERKSKRAAALAVPAAAIVGAWLAWKYAYYGGVIPNSYYAKATISLVSGWMGFAYLYEFLMSYLLLPFLVIGAWRARRLLRPAGPRLLVIILLLWAGYIVRVGGDFMEFRFILPILPFAMTLLAWLIVSFGRRVRVVLACVVLAGSLWHALTFDTAAGVASIEKLRGHIENEDENWDEVGRVLGHLFAGEPDSVTIATTAAGAVPYFSRLKTIDMFGMNDEWVARKGAAWSIRPGHQRIATHQYLHERGVNLVVGHPWVEPIDSASTWPITNLELMEIFRIWNVQPPLMPSNAGTIEIPLGNGFRLTVLYLEPHEAIDRVIERERLEFNPLSGQGGEANGF